MKTEKTEKPTTKVSAKIMPEDTAKDKALELPKEDKNIATWQFRYANYRTILPYVDETAGLTQSGKRQNAVMKARNYRRDLDLRIPEEKKMHEALSKDPRRELDFWLLTGAKRKQKASEQGANLAKLLAMPEPQLRGILSGDQVLAVGLNPATATRHDLAMAIITSYNQTLVQGPDKENDE